jgi:ATP adenylyltransferase
MTRLWTPWRSAYMQQKKDQSACIFCDAAASETDEENLVVHRGQLAFVMLNRYPYTSGHVMIAPYAHVSRLAQAGSAAAAEIMYLARDAEQVIQQVYRPDGLNLGMNLGEAAGAGIEQHIHLHVLPRWNGDANFMTSVAETRVIPESLTDTYTKLKNGFLEFNKQRTPF